MRRVLLDTHALIWFLAGSPELSERAYGLLADSETAAFVSPVSAYEIGLKTTLGKLRPLPASFEVLVGASGLTILPVLTVHLEKAGALPLTNRDPWDRILTAQAILDDLELVSRDSRLPQLGARIFW